ncbi:putative negative regulator of RcsB-dependent stress response [Rhabdobacter roseus]|uniref:Putative negative regulator of RcsB-dependent stress response n=1 Tax=Rhabdobacter roseus TaxID=1655419 RepID=A0A840TS72_9BACT|nr:tetratricopeptide repeat protein [Rhabdobacter roseus]MBB5286801.1 putative negative regulator of RcsB-dependent stress response [Rhabdobacter roseus]
MSKKNSEGAGLDFIESPEALAGQISKAETFFRKNQKLLIGAGAAIVLALVAFAGYRFYIDGQESTAQVALSNAVYDFEADSLQRALNGSGGNEGLLGIADNYGGTDAANLASFYAGVSLLKQGKFDEAIDRLKSFSSSDLLVEARAKSLIGDAYMEKNQPAEAISFYKKAADYKANQFFTPIYLMKLGIAQEKAQQPKDAISSYKRIIDEFPLSAEVVNAKKYMGMLEGQVGE